MHEVMKYLPIRVGLYAAVLALGVCTRAYGQFQDPPQPVIAPRWDPYEHASPRARSKYEAENRARIRELQAEEKRVGKDSAAIIPAVMSLGAWYSETEQYSLARPAYARVVAIIEATSGPDDLTLIEPLNGIAHAYEEAWDSMRGVGRSVNESSTSMRSPAT